MGIFEGNMRGVPLTSLKFAGHIYQIVFLIVNLILMFNFVIAILSSTFAKYEAMKIGLYYNVIVRMFASLQWDDCNGVLTTA